MRRIAFLWLFLASVASAEITYVGAGTLYVTPGVNEASAEVARHASTTDGDLQVLCVSAVGNDDGITVNETGWSEVADVVGLTYMEMAMWYKVYATGDPANTTVQIDANNAQWRAQIYTYRGIDTASPSDATVATVTLTSNSNTHNPAAITVATTGATAISCVVATQSACDTDASVIAPTNYTKLATSADADGSGFQECYAYAHRLNVSAGSEDPGNWSGLDQSTVNDPDSSSITWAISPAAAASTAPFRRRREE